ncbi:hypothetical protein [Mycobacterium kiyosense]|uniref:hypothetical protein n=1 Tax=Mycobacterium kiyosense TaxID=2871094 RepID=UPI002231C2DF|nr:hypothetical protein [Mycobacterium kiyosense]
MASAAVAATMATTMAAAVAAAMAAAAVVAAMASTSPVAIRVQVPTPRVIWKGFGLCLNARCRAQTGQP